MNTQAVSKKAISNKDQVFSMLPKVARQRLMIVSLGWVLAAAIEALAYIVLAFAIINHWTAYWVVLSAILAILLTVLVTRAGYLTGVRLAGDLFADLGQSLAWAKLSWFNSEQRAQIGKIAGQSIPGFMSIPAHQLQTFLHAPCIPLFILIGLGLVAGFKAMLVALVLICIAFLAQFYAQRALMRTDTQRNEAELATSQSTLELVDHLELLRTAAGSVKAIERIEKRWNGQEKIFSNINRAASTATFVATLAGVLPMAGIALYWVLSGSQSATLLLALLILIGRATAPLAELATAGLGLNDLFSSIRNFNQVTHAPALSEPEHPKLPATQNISVQAISHLPVLENISFDIPYGARVNITGVSGSGKSTLLELLMRFDDPEQGHIKLGDISLDQMKYQDLVENIAYVSQEPIIFTGTLAENIRMAKPDTSDVDVEAIARRTALGSVIERSPEGIYQSVGQQGASLSGGERQRVAIARALLKDAPILLLDEATSALDEATERDVIQTIRDLSHTVIFVTHRDAAVWEPTQTIVLDTTQNK